MPRNLLVDIVNEAQQSRKESVSKLFSESLMPSTKEIREGVGEGFLATVDPAGVLAQYISKKLGYDLETLGGRNFFGERGEVFNTGDTYGKAIAKTLTLTGGLAAWTTPELTTPLLVAQGAVLAANLYLNYKFYKEGVDYFE